jgi:hypothetical protein
MIFIYFKNIYKSSETTFSFVYVACFGHLTREVREKKEGSLIL